MEINNHSIQFMDNAVFLDETKSIVISDIHIGIEEHFRKNGILFPLNEKEELLNRLKILIKTFNPKKLIILGDFLHHFQKVPTKVYEIVNEMDNLLKGIEVILILGNHDIMAKYVLKENTRFKIVEYFFENGILFVHGDKKFQNSFENVNLLLMGHEHPVLEINKQRFSAYLEISKKDFKILLIPAFSNIVSGVKINEIEGNFMSPYLKDVKKEEIFPIIIGEDVLKFPNLFEIEKYI
ncbi:metallophosphoesterase [Methanococcus vannielii SB]|uniref:Metallophosphoesterase n=1 Tax=Methanococcus vannielii (strain ATCC 35089 / DSM 1224 / JCM 13029 / OCM 148 / SB) TaxID=406327 RepID=A6UPE9_METVS|nr:metallophosphoesterase [Methanococcus vannielii]ABR54371.1 metallophosphoesterase [Methanococcus vannielii SB]